MVTYSKGTQKKIKRIIHEKCKELGAERMERGVDGLLLLVQKPGGAVQKFRRRNRLQKDK